MSRRVSLLARATLVVLLASTAALATTVLLVPEEAEAAFPGKNGRIAFVSRQDGDAEIYTIRPDGSGLRQITHNRADDEGPKWSPDGTKLAFWSYRDGDSEIYVKDLRSGQLTQLTHNLESLDYSPAWSPDGTKIVFSTDRHSDEEQEFYAQNLVVMNADGSGQMDLTDPVGWSLEADAEWSPDGSAIVFQRGEDGYYDMWSVDPDGSDLREITHNVGRIMEQSPDWSPDGKRIVSSFVKEDETVQLWTMDPDGSNKQRLTSIEGEDRYPAWSPNGRKIASVRRFYAQSPNSWDIFIMSADGTHPKNITNTPSEREYDLDWKAAPTTSTP